MKKYTTLITMKRSNKKDYQEGIDEMLLTCKVVSNRFTGFNQFKIEQSEYIIKITFESTQQDYYFFTGFIYAIIWRQDVNCDVNFHVQ